MKNWSVSFSKKKIKYALIAVLLLTLALTACSGKSEEAGAVLESYEQNIADGDYEAAYELISDFDKENISKEVFVNWQTAVSRVQKIESFSISKKIDRFKNYKYMGYEFGNAYGLEVTRTLKKMIPDIKMTGYEGETFKILVTEGGGEWRVALLVTQMESNLEKLNQLLAEKETEAK